MVHRRTGACKFLAYFQAYTNTYADLDALRARYELALAQPGVIGLSVGTRPDCVSPPVLDLLAGYLEQGLEVWLELGLQSSFDETLHRVNRGHGFAEYRAAVRAARQRGLPVCTHLMAGLPGETQWHVQASLLRVLEEGVDGLKLHPLHVVRGTRLAGTWKAGAYEPLGLDDYIALVADLIEITPADVVYHRLTGTAPAQLLLTPWWCGHKWLVLNAIENELRARGSFQGSALNRKRARMH